MLSATILLMVFYLCLRWWYSAGWYWVFKRVLVARCNWIMETFSVSDLVRTLFAPFRQTYAGKVKGSLETILRGILDRTISRVIGFVVRTFLIGMALVGMLVVLIIALATLLAWPFIPLLPIIALVMINNGVTG